MNAEKLAKLQSQVRIGGKGTPRRKVKKVQKVAGGEEKKLETTLKKLNVQQIPGVEEVNMFKNDGNILHFTRPIGNVFSDVVKQSVASNTFTVSGTGYNKDLTQLLPGVLTQLGPDSLAELKKLADRYQAQQAAAGKSVVAADDDDVPELVDQQTFEEAVE